MLNRASVICIVGVVLLSMSLAAQQAPAGAATPKAAVFVFADRTDRHAKYSKSEAFHSVVDDVQAFLNEKRVSIAKDEFAGRSYSENQTPTETILNMARDSQATSVLHLNVDRPLTKWMRVAVRCYDISGKLLWEDKAESGGGLSGEHGLKVTKERLRELLSKKIGQEGIPLLPPTGAEGK